MSAADPGDELQLLGCMMRCTSADEIAAMTFAVPPAVFGDRLNAALWRAGEHLAQQGVADAVTTVQAVVAAGLWPRDCHHEVTLRALDAVEAARFDPWEWQVPALDVLDAYARRETARRLSKVASVLPSARLAEVVRELLGTVDHAENVLGWIGHVERQAVAA